MRLHSIALALILTATPPLAAAPAHYLLEPEKSVVAFETDFGGGAARITGKMPVLAADLTIDFDRVAASHVAVTLDAAHADTSNPLATEAMMGAKVLDTAEFPQITFESTAVRAAGDGASVTGNLTIRGVTRPVTLDARIYRQKGTAEGDRSSLSILLTGTVSRSAFGASGFPDMVGDDVRLKILARIRRDG